MPAPRKDLSAAEQAMQQWVDLSHDMRTPLSIILSTVQFQQARLGDLCQPEAAQIERNAQQLMRLLGNLIDLAGLDAGSVGFLMHPVEIVSWLRRVAETCAPFAQTKGVEFTFAVAEPALWVVGDEVKLERCVLNLISNAVRFTEPGGLVCLSAERVGDQVSISVSDNGCGMDAAQMAGLFQRFHIHNEQTLLRGGSGLGLSVVKSFIEHMGGRVELESEAGEGTCARLLLPSIVAPPDAPVGGSEVIGNAAVELSVLKPPCE